MVHTGNAGIPTPIPDTFDFDAWMIAPKNLPISGISLHIQNHENCCVEESNDESQFLTICCHNDHANFPDVGPPLQPF